MGKFFKKLLDVTLPFSGDKVKLGTWILAIAGAEGLGVDMHAVEVALASGALPVGGLALLSVGLIHKYLKNKYGVKEHKE